MEKTISSLAFDYSIKRSQRVKNTRIVVTSNKIEVVAPLKISQSTIHSFVLSKQDWIISAHKKVTAATHNIKKLAPDLYTTGSSVPLMGQQLKLIIRHSTLNKPKISLLENEFMISLPSHLQNSADNNDLIRTTIIGWMKKHALKYAENYVDIHAKKYGLYPRFIKIKTQKSRWGSCGIHNDININWLLILAPAEVMEYVVVHELCHIKERNHSNKFWRLVEAHLPDYQKHRAWLKTNGQSLMLGL